MKTKYNGKGVSPMLAGMAAIIVFALALTLAVGSLGSAEGRMKTAREAPDSLVSAGAPRSQLELKRMFESMSLVYTENGKEIYEPISAEYRRSIEEKIASGESPMLSVEEILFIISDSAAAYGKYDVIRFKDSSGKIEAEIDPFDAGQSDKMPFHRSAYDRIIAVTELIRLRIEYMSAEGAMTESADGTFRYEPRQVEREKNKEDYENDSAFLFKNDGDRAVIFETGGGEVVLYPAEKESALCRMKVLLVIDREITENERNILSSSGYDASRCRNITPEYWYSETNIRLFVFGGRVILTDAEKSTDLLPEGYKLASAALCRDGVYFTASSETGSSVWKYSGGEINKIFESNEKYLAVIEPLQYEKYDCVEVYAALPAEDERFVTALECIGEPIIKYFTE